MTIDSQFDLFFATVPGFEPLLLQEAKSLGFSGLKVEAGGVSATGTLQDIWRANLMLRGASHILMRLASFRVVHLAKLDKQAHKLPWGDWLTKDSRFRVEAVCKKSRIYHSKAASDRVAAAIVNTVKATEDPEADLTIKLRVLDDICTISVDTSGAPLHRRGHKEAVNKAPMRESLASLILRGAGFDGSESVIDPMCGSGTFVIEAAEIASSMVAGRSRSFAFEQLATFDRTAFLALKEKCLQTKRAISDIVYGFDRDKGAIDISQKNAVRAGVDDLTSFTHQALSDLSPPTGCQKPGLIVINPPYGVRIGEVRKLRALYQTMGKVFQDRFPGWRVALVTSSDKLAAATELPFFSEKITFPHGSIPVTLYQTGPLGQ